MFLSGTATILKFLPKKADYAAKKYNHKNLRLQTTRLMLSFISHNSLRPTLTRNSTIIKNLKNGILLSLVVIFTCQFLYCFTFIARNGETQSVLAASNADAGGILSATIEASWLKDHCGYGCFIQKQKSPAAYAYGLLYPRLAKTLFVLGLGKSDVIQNTEIGLHIALMAISLFSLFGICYILAITISPSKIGRLALLIGLFQAFLLTPTWRDFVIHVHPDIFLAFLSLLFVRKFYIYQQNSKIKDLILCGFFGGLGLITKLPFFMFIPTAFLFILFPVSKESLKKTAYFSLAIAGASILFGSPQILELTEQYSSITWFQSLITHFATWESFCKWWKLLFLQSWKPLLIALLGIIFFRPKNVSNQTNWSTFLKASCVSALPFFYFLTKHILAYTCHYVLPYNVLLIYLVSLAVIRLRSKFKFFNFNNQYLLSKISFFLTLLVVYKIPGFQLPEKLSTHYSRISSLREPMRKTSSEILHLVNAGHIIMVEAYIPYPLKHPRVKFAGHLTTDLEKFETINPTIIALNKHQVKRIMEGEKPSDFLLASRANYMDLRKFYILFYQKLETTDPRGNHWQLFYEDKAGVQLWKKQDTSSEETM